jgi:hypothetical protein
MHEIICRNIGYGGSKEHDFIIWMCSDKKNMMFPFGLFGAFVDVDCDEGEKVESEKNVLK